MTKLTKSGAKAGYFVLTVFINQPKKQIVTNTRSHNYKHKKGKINCRTNSSHRECFCKQWFKEEWLKLRFMTKSFQQVSGLQNIRILANKLNKTRIQNVQHLKTEDVLFENQIICFELQMCCDFCLVRLFVSRFVNWCWWIRMWENFSM